MSYDIKIFNVCDHIVDNKHYNSQLCPRCNGESWYFDIHFDPTGQSVLASGDIKLQQEILKVMLDEKYSNLFHPNWGSEVTTLVGSKMLSNNAAKVELMIRNALEYLQSIQVDEYATNGNLSINEIINKILYINIKQVDTTSYFVNVIFSNQVEQIYSQKIIL